MIKFNTHPKFNEHPDLELKELYVKEDDGTALETLMARHAGLMTAVISNICKNRTDAREVLISCCGSIALNLKCFDAQSERHLSNWIARIAKNRAIDSYRAKLGNRFDCTDFSKRGFTHDDGKRVEDPDAVLLRKEMLEKALLLTGSLPERLRNVAEPIFFDGMSYENVAMLRGLPVGTVKSQVSEARKLLRGARG